MIDCIQFKSVVVAIAFAISQSAVTTKIAQSADSVPVEDSWRAECINRCRESIENDLHAQFHTFNKQDWDVEHKIEDRFKHAFRAMFVLALIDCEKASKSLKFDASAGIEIKNRFVKTYLLENGIERISWWCIKQPENKRDKQDFQLAYMLWAASSLYSEKHPEVTPNQILELSRTLASTKTWAYHVTNKNNKESAFHTDSSAVAIRALLEAKLACPEISIDLNDAINNLNGLSYTSNQGRIRFSYSLERKNKERDQSIRCLTFLAANSLDFARSPEFQLASTPNVTPFWEEVLNHEPARGLPLGQVHYFKLSIFEILDYCLRNGIYLEEDKVRHLLDKLQKNVDLNSSHSLYEPAYISWRIRCHCKLIQMLQNPIKMATLEKVENEWRLEIEAWDSLPNKPVVSISSNRQHLCSIQIKPIPDETNKYGNSFKGPVWEKIFESGELIEVELKDESNPSNTVSPRRVQRLN